MNYCSSIVVDFGSTNSGCARIELEENNSGYRTPTFIQGNQTYAKDATWFFVHPNFWQQICGNYDQISDSDFRIRSRALPYTENPNVIWGRQHIRALAETIEAEKWIGFKYFKMRLYREENFIVNGETILIQDVVKLFLRILKIECLDFEKGRRRREVSAEEIQWGLTIPTIWGDRERKTMTAIASEVYGKHIRVLTEPEGPVLSGLIHSIGDGSFSLKKGRVSLVTDIGGGTTDITLLEEVSDDATCEYPLKAITSTDGIGVGGNNIDEAYWTYILRQLSNGKNSDDGYSYDSLSDDSLKECLLNPFIDKLGSFIDMEDAWLNFKHGQTPHIQFPPAYLKWLKTAGHNQVAEKLTGIMIGTDDIDMNELKMAVFWPTFQTIIGKVREFLQLNIDKIPSDPSLCMVVKAGGLSLSNELRNLVDSQVNDLGLNFTSASLGADSVSVSGSIMDGACIILLNRKIINRKAPFNIFYDMGNVTLSLLRDRYKDLEVNMNLGQLEDLLERDVKNGADRFQKAVPVGIKGKYLKDHSASFVSARDNQTEIVFHFYGKEDGYIIYPHNNPECRLLGEITFKTQNYQSFLLTIDFNEFPNNNNFHYIITSEINGDIIDEGNIPVRFNS